jgi:hypothetical protein
MCSFLRPSLLIVLSLKELSIIAPLRLFQPRVIGDSSAVLLTGKGITKSAKAVKRGEEAFLWVEGYPTSNISPFCFPEVEGLCLEELVAEAQHITIIVATTVA